MESGLERPRRFRGRDRHARQRGAGRPSATAAASSASSALCARGDFALSASLVEEMARPRSRIRQRRAPPRRPADHPTIAVIPFANLSGDPGQDLLGDGITEDLITALAKVNWLYVATRASCFACKGQPLGIGQIARKLGVRYLVDGSIRRLAGRVRITVQLIDGFAEHQIWAERYDMDGGANFKLFDRICEKILAAVEPHLYLAEHLRAQRKPAMQLNAWECVVRALSLMNTRDQGNVTAAHELLQKAVSIDPASAQIHSLLSIVTTLRVHMSWADRRDVIPDGAGGGAHSAGPQSRRALGPRRARLRLDLEAARRRDPAVPARDRAQSELCRRPLFSGARFDLCRAPRPDIRARRYCGAAGAAGFAGARLCRRPRQRSRDGVVCDRKLPPRDRICRQRRDLQPEFADRPSRTAHQSRAWRQIP